MAFIITECKTHGRKVTEDKQSADIYRVLASECHRNLLSTGECSHNYEISCWACCEEMTLGVGWQSDSHLF